MIAERTPHRAMAARAMPWQAGAAMHANRAMTGRARQLPALTGIRFFAALHVVVFHCTRWATAAWPEPVRNLAGSGFTAVGLFFVLSGFILTYTHQGDGARRAFYAGRAARIYPVYLLGLLLSAPFFVWKHVRAGAYGRLLVEGGAVIGLVQAYAPSLSMAWNPPAWSLSVEATFYLLFPFLAPRLLRARLWAAALVGLAAWGISVGFPIAYLALLPDGVVTPTSDTVGFFLDVLKYNPIVRLPEFVVGIVLGRLFVEGVARDWLGRHAAWLAPATLVAIGGILAMSSRIPYPLLHNGLLLPFFAILIVTLASGEGPLARLLGSRPLCLLGESSYALYILHIPLVILAHHAGAAVLGPAFLGTSAFTVLFFVLAVLVSVASYRLVEVPLRARLRAALSRQGAPRGLAVNS